MCHVICRIPPSSWQSPLGRSRLSALLSSPLWIKWMRLILKRVMSKQHSFHVTFVLLTFWWVWDSFVVILTRPLGCWVCLPYYCFTLTLSTLKKRPSQRLLLWWILHNYSWKWSKWTPAPWRILLWVKLEGFTVRHAIMRREVTWFIFWCWGNFSHLFAAQTSPKAYGSNSQSIVAITKGYKCRYKWSNVILKI